jgi:hypothetical protein
MSDNTPKTSSRISAWLPVATLALSAAAFGLGAPARVARAVRRGTPVSALFAADSAMRDESAIFPMPSALRLRAPDLPSYVRDAHMILGRQIAAAR